MVGDADGVAGLSEGELDLIERITRCVAGSERPVAFLLGSALTMPAGPGLTGIPGVRAVVEMICEELRPRADTALEQAVAAGDFTAAYQVGFVALRKRTGQDGVNRLIRRAVLEAHEPLGMELQATVLAGHPSQRRAACEGLLTDSSGWRPLLRSAHLGGG